MAAATDYLSVAQAKVDMRLDDGTFEDDATIERYIGDAVGMVSGIVGYDLLEVETADIKPALQGLVAFAANYRFEGAHDVPAALYALAAPHRMLVDPDEDDEDEEMDEAYQTYEADLTAGQVLTVDFRHAEIPFTWSAVAETSAMEVELSDEDAPQEGDWQDCDSVAPGRSVRRGVAAPVAWMRWTAANNGTGTVRVVYRGKVKATVA